MSGSDKIIASALPVNLSIRRTKVSTQSESLTANVEEIEKENIIFNALT